MASPLPCALFFFVGLGLLPCAPSFWVRHYGAGRKPGSQPGRAAPHRCARKRGGYRQSAARRVSRRGALAWRSGFLADGLRASLL